MAKKTNSFGIESNSGDISYKIIGNSCDFYVWIKDINNAHHEKGHYSQWIKGQSSKFNELKLLFNKKRSQEEFKKKCIDIYNQSWVSKP